MSRFFKTGKFKISQNTIDTANKFYDLGYSIDLNEEVYDLIFDFITFFNMFLLILIKLYFLCRF